MTMEAAGALPGLAVRACRPEDVPSIRELDRLSGLALWEATSYESLLGRDESFFAVAVDLGGGVRGFCLALRLVGEMELAKIAVDPAFQGKGVGQRLLDEALSWAAGGGCRDCYLEVRPSNRRALAFYFRNGFEEVGRRVGYYRNPEEDALIMRKRLPGVAGALVKVHGLFRDRR